MKAFIVEKYGKDSLRAAEVPEPTVGRRDVLVQIRAASINPLDKMIRNGEFKRLLKYKTPFVLGHDLAGVVTRVGAEVTDFKPGDEVYARPRDLRIGTFAEYIAIDQADVALKPTSLTMEEAAAVPLVALAAWQALVDLAQVKARSEDPRPRGRGWTGLDGDPTRQAPGRLRLHHRPRQRRREAAHPRRGRSHRLHEDGLRPGSLRLRRRARLPWRRQPREVAHCAQAWRSGDQRRRASRRCVRRADRPTVAEARHGTDEPQGPNAGQEVRGALLVLLQCTPTARNRRRWPRSTTGECLLRRSTAPSRSTRRSRRWRTWSRDGRNGKIVVTFPDSRDQP